MDNGSGIFFLQLRCACIGGCLPRVCVCAFVCRACLCHIKLNSFLSRGGDHGSWLECKQAKTAEVVSGKGAVASIIAKCEWIYDGFLSLSLCSPLPTLLRSACVCGTCLHWCALFMFAYGVGTCFGAGLNLRLINFPFNVYLRELVSAPRPLPHSSSSRSCIKLPPTVAFNQIYFPRILSSLFFE